MHYPSLRIYLASDHYPPPHTPMHTLEVPPVAPKWLFISYRMKLLGGAQKNGECGREDTVTGANSSPDGATARSRNPGWASASCAARDW